MLDVISNFLSVMKAQSGGVSLPSGTGSKAVTRALSNVNDPPQQQT